MALHHKPIQVETLQAVIGRQGIRLRELVRCIVEVSDLLDAKADQMDTHDLPSPTSKQLRVWSNMLRGVKEVK